jgi:2-methylcitrate dehydratase PrpD
MIMARRNGDYASRISKYLVDFKKEPLARKTVDQVKITLLDTIGCMISASKTTANRKIKEFIWGGNQGKEFRVFDSFHFLSVENACFYGSHLAAFLDFDTGHRLGGVHTSAVAVPCALSACINRRLTGNDLIRQIVAGTELAARLGMATQPFQFRRGLDPSGTCNGFNAIAVFSLAYDLDDEQIKESIRIGSVLVPLSPTQWTYTGSMSKSLSIAASAKLGYMAVQLARNGFTGPDKGLEGPEGFLNGVVGPYKAVPGVIFDPPLGQQEITRLYFKLYPSCGWTHSVIDAVLKATDGQRLQQGSIEKVEVIVSEQVAKQSNTDPKDETAAKFSIPFCASVALLKGSVGMEHFTNDHLMESDISSLCQRIIVQGNPDYDKLFPKVRPAEVSVFLKNGHILKAKVDHPKGDPENMASPSELRNKFLNLTKDIISESLQSKIISLIESLEEMTDLSELGRAMGI